MKKGFTLIELLVAISIIAVLSTIGLVTYQGIQAKTRDSVRKSDLQKLAIALELYYQQHNGSYISGTGTCETDTPVFYHETNGIAPNMSDKIVPKDPSSTATNEIKYCYISSNGSTYTLCANLENISDPDYVASGCNSSSYHYVLTPR